METLRDYRAYAILILAAWLGAAAGPVQGAPPPARPAPEFPLHITAAKLEADQNAGIVTFTGQVKATYGESILYADQLRVFFHPKAQGPVAKGAKGAAAGVGKPAPAQEEAGASLLGDLGGKDIERIVATGQVRYVTGDRVATGQEATYYKDRDEVVLVGDPQVWQKENNLKGERIIFNLKDNTMVAESSPAKRVEANLYPAQPAAGGSEATSLPIGPRKDRRP